MAQAFTALTEMATKFWFRPHLLQLEYQHNTLGVTLTEASRKFTTIHFCDNILTKKKIEDIAWMQMETMS